MNIMLAYSSRRECRIIRGVLVATILALGTGCDGQDSPKVKTGPATPTGETPAPPKPPAAPNPKLPEGYASLVGVTKWGTPFASIKGLQVISQSGDDIRASSEAFDADDRPDFFRRVYVFDAAGLQAVDETNGSGLPVQDFRNLCERLGDRYGTPQVVKEGVYRWTSAHTTVTAFTTPFKGNNALIHVNWRRR